MTKTPLNSFFRPSFMMMLFTNKLTPSILKPTARCLTSVYAGLFASNSETVARVFTGYTEFTLELCVVGGRVETDHAPFCGAIPGCFRTVPERWIVGGVLGDSVDGRLYGQVSLPKEARLLQ